MSKTAAELKSLCLENTEKFIDELFAITHVQAKTKSGDISPEDFLKLRSIVSELSGLLYSQVMYNNPEVKEDQVNHLFIKRLNILS